MPAEAEVLDNPRAGIAILLVRTTRQRGRALDFNQIGATSFYILLSNIPEAVTKEKGLYLVGGRYLRSNNKSDIKDERADISRSPTRRSPRDEL